MTKDTQPFGHDDHTSMFQETLKAVNTDLSGVELLEHVWLHYKPSHTFALFSGGHDSLCATHLAMSTGKIDAVVHCNTGIGLRATRVFVREVCERFNWPLIEVRAKEDCGQDYEKIVEEHGFPGPDAHLYMYTLLKERCLRFLEKQYRQYTTKPRRRIPIALISGCRVSESTRRMGNVKAFDYADHRVWTAIIREWDDADKVRYMAEHGLPLNPTSGTMCMSGECLCGAFASKGELRDWVKFHGDDPGVQNLLRIREKLAAKFPWDWDDPGPPAWFLEQREGQQMMYDMEPEPDKFQHLCTKCNLRQEIAEDLEDKQ